MHETTISIGAVATESPITIQVGELLERAEQLMDENGLRHLPVVRQGGLVGMLSDRDVKLALGTLRARSEQLAVEEVAQTEVFAVEPSASLEEVLAEMVRRHIGSVAVLAKGRLVGIFTSMDACRLLASQLAESR